MKFSKEFEEFTKELDEINAVNIPKRKYLSFDIELYNELFDENEKEVDASNLIPSVAAFTVDGETVEFFYDEPYMTVDTAKRVLTAIRDYAASGYTPFAWNGVHFDFKIMGLYSGMLEEWGEVALCSVDSMLSIGFRKGYFKALDNVLQACGLETKLHSVTLNDGTILDGMSGKLAPKLWRDGEYDAVKAYLAVDVIQPYKLIRYIEENGLIRFTSQAGKNNTIKNFPLENVFSLPYLKIPNTSWMSGDFTPINRREPFSWIPKSVMENYIPEKTGVELYWGEESLPEVEKKFNYGENRKTIDKKPKSKYNYD